MIIRKFISEYKRWVSLFMDVNYSDYGDVAVEIIHVTEEQCSRPILLFVFCGQKDLAQMSFILRCVQCMTSVVRIAIHIWTWSKNFGHSRITAVHIGTTCKLTSSRNCKCNFCNLIMERPSYLWYYYQALLCYILRVCNTMVL